MGVYVSSDQVPDLPGKRKSEVKTRVVIEKTFVHGRRISAHAPPKCREHGVAVVKKARDFYNSENKFAYRHSVLSRNSEGLMTKCYEVPYPVSGSQACEERENPQSPPRAPVNQKTKWGAMVSGVASFLSGLAGRINAESRNE